MSLVLQVPVERLGTTLAPLRGRRTDRHSDLAPLPLRVAARHDGGFEVLDGFKRLAQWRSDSLREVPVVVEPVCGIACKVRLLQAHAEALQYHQGSPMRLVYDNQTTVTLGRVAKVPLWHPTFLEFARFYGFQPYAARVGHKERKGKVERPFAWIESDLLRGSVFDSLEHLRHQTQQWLDNVANVRRHSTTARRVDQMYAEEKPLLIALPPTPFLTARSEQRKVQKDGYVPIDGSFYPAPAHLVGRDVPVRIYPDRVEILDALDDVEPGSPQQYTLDAMPATEEHPHAPQD